jgi:hypothetical protein
LNVDLVNEKDMKNLDEFLKKTILEIDASIPKKADLIKDRKIQELTDRIGLKNMVVLLKLSKVERGDILKRLKKMKEIR